MVDRVVTATPVVVDYAIMCQAEQIGAEPCADFVTGARANEIGPHILEQLLRIIGITTLPQQIAIHAHTMSPIDNLESRKVAIAVGQHECFIASPVYHSP
jgi:hypothetical protein